MRFQVSLNVSESDGIIKPAVSNTIKINVEPSYKGTTLIFPLAKDNYYELIESFQAKKQLHPSYVIQLLEKTIEKLKHLKNINYISTSITKQITIVGDLHGQLDDLLMIFYKVIFWSIFY